MERFFNTAGPCNPAKHYMLPALDRLPDIRRLVAMEQYFVIHAPRQTGKTTAIKALGSRRLDLCVEYRDKRYAVEVKTSKNFAGEKSYGQLADYLSTLGLDEGWMAVFDVEGTKPWDERLYVRDVTFKGKALHIVGL